MYKNYTIKNCRCSAYMTKFLLVMKLTAILLIAVIMQVNATIGKAQKVSFKERNTSLERVFREIKRQTGYNILVSGRMLNTATRISVDFSGTSLDEVMEKCLEGKALTYSITDRTIIVRPKEAIKESTVTYADGVVSGQVKDPKKGDALPGVTIKIENGTWSKTAMTDNNGNYRFPAVPEGSYKISFSSIGFEKLVKEITVKSGQQLTVNAELKENIAELAQLVIVGYGAQKKANLTAAVTQIDAKDFKGQSATGIGQAIQGRAAGVQIYRDGGAPGAGVSINIRGVGSFINNAPLIVIDGVPAGSLDLISPDEVETVTILKDASAAAIYGSNGANGVIMVTTKSGKKGEAKLNYSYKAGFNEAANMPRLLNATEYALLQNEARINSGRMPLFSDDQIRNMGEGTNWRDQILQTGIRQEHYVGVSGGAPKVNYLVSANYLDEKGIAIHSWYKRLNVRTKVDAHVGEKFSMGIQAQYTFSKSQEGASFTNATTFSPTIPLRTPDGRPGVYSKYDPSGAVSMGLNPVANRELTLGYHNNTPKNFLLATAYAEYRFIPSLKLRSNVTYERSTSLRKTFDPSYEFRNYEGELIASAGRLPANRTFKELYVENDRYLITNTLEFNKTFNEDHNLKAVAGYEEQKSNWDVMYMSRVGGYPTNDFLNIGVNATTGVTVSHMDPNDSSIIPTTSAIRSVFGRINYDYKGKYLFEAVARRDGSSKFAPNNRWAFFPSASVGWRISAEEFFSPLKTIVDDLKFRASYGLTGNSGIPDFGFNSNVVIEDKYVFNNNAVQIGSFNSMPNKNIRWETNKLLNIGFDAALLNQRLNITLDAYQRKSEDLLTQVSIPATTGISTDEGVLGTQYQNVGILKNRGIELFISWKDKINSDLGYNLSFSGSYNQNELQRFNGLTDQQILGPAGEYVNQIGRPYRSIFGFKSVGVWQNAAEIAANPHRVNDQPGDLRFEDVDGNGKVDEADRTILGNSIPKYTLGLSGGLNYKSFDFNFLLQGDLKKDFLQYGYGYFEYYLQNNNNYAYALNRWHGEGTSNQHPRLIAGSEYLANTVSSYFVQDASYIRLRHVELGYTLPQSLLGKIKISALRVYAGADNLLTFTKYYGLDPEQKDTFGRDAINYPQARTFTLGLNVTF
ncbi:TonB-linked outer membrane protein, SusC/RagA family [Pedobacter caeni]|uniref:TonB-linked outer membrane protein, SusC/RagA family n=2 Tax=Pedobacter caeni TaxID=288992 RepID=A0A1M5BAH0_9SPHI|nr:TonB-linked outer membrane protein, SusC/RagA family [Pedobacter caeni]